MSYVFSSHFKGFITEFISERRSLGFSYRSGRYRLAEFDRFCCEYFPDDTVLTRELVLQWLELRSGEHVNNQSLRATYVRQLGQYMQRTGTSAFIIPLGITKKRIRYVPHVFTTSELQSFFSVVDQCNPSVFTPTRHLVAPILFRLLYCCGLRPSEAAHLKAEDFDWEQGQAFVRQSKGRKDRVVMLSNDVWALCQQYDDVICERFPKRTWFFPNRLGKPFHPSTFDDWFHEFWDKAGISHVGGNSPRLYDLRHTFCVHRLNQWVKDGKDVQALLPYLSRYLGHVSISTTDYYLHLVPEFFPEWRLRANAGETLIPEVSI